MQRKIVTDAIFPPGVARLVCVFPTCGDILDQPFIDLREGQPFLGMRLDRLDDQLAVRFFG